MLDSSASVPLSFLLNPSFRLLHLVDRRLELDDDV